MGLCLIEDEDPRRTGQILPLHIEPEPILGLLEVEVPAASARGQSLRKSGLAALPRPRDDHRRRLPKSIGHE